VARDCGRLGARGDRPRPQTIEEFGAGESFDAVVCSLVLCSVD
jgi:hypothetical protein